MRSRYTDGTDSHLTYVQIPKAGKQFVGGVKCSRGMPQVSAELCDHVVSHMMAVGVNVEDYIPRYQTAEWWARQYQVLRNHRTAHSHLYHGGKERPHCRLALSTLKPPMVDVRDTVLHYLSNNTH